MKNQNDRIERALREAGRVDRWELHRQSLRVQRFRLAAGRGGEPCELVVVPYRRWKHWRQTKAGRKGGPIAGALWRERNGTAYRPGGDAA
ncbi:MAG: hypothetical protein OJF55_002849 [Rhodanobacteraceae bacterium]|jgi:hypothetical protein|nr:MAG: hypothetical protein OJF55_002849 [Rhodanobacteraceae bacterium]